LKLKQKILRIFATALVKTIPGMCEVKSKGEGSQYEFATPGYWLKPKIPWENDKKMAIKIKI
jgi:hypothetical protein